MRRSAMGNMKVDFILCVLVAGRHTHTIDRKGIHLTVKQVLLMNV